MSSHLHIIQEILTHRLSPQDVERILSHLAESEPDRYAAAVADVLGHVASLLEISNRLLDNLLLMMIRISTQLVDAERGTLFLIDTENKELFSRVMEGETTAEIRFPLDQGIAGAVVASGEPIVLADPYRDPRFNQAIDRQTGFQTRNILALPIRNEQTGRVIGVLEVLNKRRGAFTPADVAALQTITAQAATALLNAQNFEQVQQARENECRLLEVTAAISSELKLKPLLEKIMESVSLILNCDRSTLFLYDEKRNELWSQVALGLGGQEIRFPANRGIAGESFTTGQTINIPDAYADPRFNPEIDKKTGYRTRNILCMPVVNRHGKAIGVTQVLNKRDGAFTRLDEKKLRTFSGQAAIAIENAKLFDEVLSMKNYNESILQSLSNGVISVNALRRIEKANLAALRTFGYEADQMVGKYADLFFAGDNHWIVDSLRRVIATNEPDMFYEAEIVNRKNERVAINLAIAPLRDAQNQPVGGLLVFEDLTKEKRLKGTLARYMTKEVADQLMNSEAELGGQMKELTVLFSDIRDFTTISEKLGPQETVAMLNEYFTLMVDIVFHHGGILDKFIGDAMLAVFGAPFSSGEDADRAVTTAIEMMRALRRFNADRQARGLEPIAIGAGINTDVVLVGNIGSLKRMDYTVIGDGVNLASRLEGANKFYGTHILISEKTYRSLKFRYHTREVDLLRVKGKKEPAKIYEVLDHYDRESFPELEEVLRLHAEALDLYRRREWAKAEARFREVARLRPDDGLARVYLDRCAQFKIEPPPIGWDGVWTATSKS
ncbi:MAG: Adenylate cyclase [Candidatus Ozemobacter sibiricus]|uniref:Adenylate cyclase n=1 Tax=Candidatus Ozemobacter sibiricus TaxID=2268124 RepID=A0A367ZUJ6_9BACT|nr:MAG: Adenylate cyclase [Candidatus Ozemobacter sibiricus]